MKHLKLYFSILALAAIFTLAACSSDEYHEDPSFSEEIKEELVDKSQLPQWLADYVTYLEYVPKGQDIPVTPKGFIRCEWKGKTYYELYSADQTVLHQEMYTADGEPFLLKPQDYKAFNDGVRNWTIVYLLHPSHKMPDGILYPSVCSDTLQTFFEREFSEYRSDIHGFQFYDIPGECYIVDTQEQLESIFLGYDPLPYIDFDHYSLILGRESTNIKWSLKRQQIEKTSSSERPILTLFFESHGNDDDATIDMKNQYFWALYPKVDFDLMDEVLHFNNRNTLVYTYKISRTPEVLGHYSLSDWDSEMHHLTPISESDFNKYVVGHGWIRNKKYKINCNGTVINSDSWQNIDGASSECYEFNEGYAISYMYIDAAPADVYLKQNYHYSEQKNMLYIDSTTAYQILSVNEEQMEVVMKHRGVEKNVFFYMILKRLSEERLQETRDQHWIRYEDLWREMTKEDLWHKWVLKGYLVDLGHGWAPNWFTDDRKNKDMTIRFLPDGTVEGNYYNHQFKGTYEYGGKETIIITPEGSWPEYFADIATQGKITIQFAAYMSILVGSRSYSFLRSADD